MVRFKKFLPIDGPGSSKMSLLQNKKRMRALLQTTKDTVKETSWGQSRGVAWMRTGSLDQSSRETLRLWVKEAHSGCYETCTELFTNV